MKKLAYILALLLLFYLFVSCAENIKLANTEETGEASVKITELQTEKPEPTLSQPEPEQQQITEPESEPEPEPKTEWTLCFAGDTTIGTLHEWQGASASHNMLYVVGDDYTYPLSGVREIFDAADFTMVNLEGTLTNETSAKSKKYRFRAPPEYAAVLTEGCVDAVSLDNNHTRDYFEIGLDETKETLDENGVLWASREKPLTVELEGGIKLGIVSYNTVESGVNGGDVNAYMQHITPQYQQLVDEDCDLIIGFMHWGREYTAGPENWVEELAHQMADLGFDLIVGSHAHILQNTEYYNGVPIFYSLGNFCYGGHSNPSDKDSVIVRQHIYMAEDCSIVVGATEFIPCSVSSSDSTNTFCPTPYEEGSDAWNRVLKKLYAEDFYAAASE
ncbi:MAG: CapA family protein [Oscillospiraceae bacterium]|nr:CapA family protein [Oscillospiraceae bacterium]